MEDSSMQAGNQRGSAAMMAIFLLGTLLVLTLTSFVMLETNNKVVGRQLAFYGQASNAAQAGLIETLSWFRRQTTQPVAAFNPQLNLAATTPVNDTDDSTIGIVRDYELSHTNNTWARYEVRKSEVVNITALRGKSGVGTVWQIVSHGYVYVRNDATKAYNQAPNRVIGQQSASTEIQRLQMLLPGKGAVLSGGQTTMVSRTRIYAVNSGETGILYAPPSSNSPKILDSSCFLGGNPSKSAMVSGFNVSIPVVFGVLEPELRGMADVVGATQADLPSRLPDMSLTVVTGNATFDSTHPLSGSGILVVEGNLTLGAASASAYSGLIWVGGNYVQNAPSQVSGSIATVGSATFQGTGDFSEVSYDGQMLSTVRQQMGQYRFSRAITFGSQWR